MNDQTDRIANTFNERSARYGRNDWHRISAGPRGLARILSHQP